MSRVGYPTLIHTYDGWGVIARGHNLTPEQHLEVIRDYDAAMLPAKGHTIQAAEVHFGYSPRVKWCGDRYGSSCDQEGDWHGHWYDLRANDDQSTKFTVLHVNGTTR